MNRILSARFRSASMIPLIPSPGSPNTTSTPQSQIVSMRISAAVIFTDRLPVCEHSTTPKGVNEYHDEQDQPDDTDASAVSPSVITIIATASAEQEHDKNNQQ